MTGVGLDSIFKETGKRRYKSNPADQFTAWAKNAPYLYKTCVQFKIAFRAFIYIDFRLNYLFFLFCLSCYLRCDGNRLDCPCTIMIISLPYEPQREKSYLLTYAPNADLNRPAHPHSLITVFVVCMRLFESFAIKYTPSDDSDENAQICRLI